MSDTQNWQEQLQQKVGDLLARRIGTFAEELQKVQASVNNLCQRLPETGFEVTTEEASGLEEQFQQLNRAATAEAESGFQARLDEAVSQAESRVREEYEQQIQDLRAQLASSHTGESASVIGDMAKIAGTGPEITSSANYEILKAGVTDLDNQRQQADVLATFVRHATSFAPRVLFLVIKSGHAVGWKASGFSNGLTDETARSINIAIDSSELLQSVSKSAQTVSGREDSLVLGPYASPAASSYVAIPLVIRGKVAAILFADSGAANGAINTNALETLMQVTGMAIELLPVRRAAQTAGGQPVAAAPAKAPQPQVEVRETEVRQPTITAEPTVEAATVTSLYSVPAAAEPEAQVVHEAAQATSSAQAPAGGTPSHSTSTASSSNDDEVRAHNDARRFARLLVSEVKLYNEQKVMDGRRSNDLYERLKDDIDRSRQMYEKRVSSSVAAKFDYFYDELLHTLAEGDTGKLGRGCPGPTVQVS